MRLIDTQTLELCDFHNTIPKYAILSHRWGHDEVTFQEMQHLRDKVASKTGFKKIREFCRIARSRGCLYAWVDTCCINKTDPTELAEAINSMFRWYQNSDICVVYLSDVFSTEDPEVHNAQFETSQWFRRGWTLQELLAPAQVDFYSADWHFLSTKKSCLEALVRVTGIARSALKRGRLGQFSVAQRMSWAAKRQTTRVEDTAYCLLGVFDVSMPLLYGEGRKAFVRLQEEIIRTSSDQSIFAWTPDSALQSQAWSTALAPAPRYFENAFEIERSNLENMANHFHFERKPFSVTNLGISITLPIIRASCLTSKYKFDLSILIHEWWAVLDCNKAGMPLCIPLQRTAEHGSRYQRGMLPCLTIDEFAGAVCDIRNIYIHSSATPKAIGQLPPSFNNGRWSTDVLEQSRVLKRFDGSDLGFSIFLSSFALTLLVIPAHSSGLYFLGRIFVQYNGFEKIFQHSDLLITFAILGSFFLTGSVALQAKMFVLGGLSAAGIPLQRISSMTRLFWKQDKQENLLSIRSSMWYSGFRVKRYDVHRDDGILQLYWTEGSRILVAYVWCGCPTWCSFALDMDARWIRIRIIEALIRCCILFCIIHVYVPRICKPFKQRQWPAAVRGSFWLASMFYVWYMVLIRHPS